VENGELGMFIEIGSDYCLREIQYSKQASQYVSKSTILEKTHCNGSTR